MPVGFTVTRIHFTQNQASNIIPTVTLREQLIMHLGMLRHGSANARLQAMVVEPLQPHLDQTPPIPIGM